LPATAFSVLTVSVTDGKSFHIVMLIEIGPLLRTTLTDSPLIWMSLEDRSSDDHPHAKVPSKKRGTNSKTNDSNFFTAFLLHKFFGIDFFIQYYIITTPA
jgi:hypothetical protein